MARGPNWTLVALGAGAIGVLYLLKKTSGVASAATNALASGIASVYEALTFGAPMSVTGSIDDQSGITLGPISSFPAATDSAGNTYLSISGMIYQLGPRDSAGNFTAIPTGQAATG